MITKIAAITTIIAATPANVLVRLAFSGAAGKLEVVRDVSFIVVIWVVEFVGIIEMVVVELATICSVVVVGAEYGTTTTVNNRCDEATTAPFTEAIKYAFTCNTQDPKTVGAVALLAIEIVKTALTGA